MGFSNHRDLLRYRISLIPEFLKKKTFHFVTYQMPFTHQWSCRRQRGSRQWPSWQRRYSCSQAWQHSILHRNSAIKSIVQQKNRKFDPEVNKFESHWQNKCVRFYRVAKRKFVVFFKLLCLHLNFHHFPLFFFILVNFRVKESRQRWPQSTSLWTISSRWRKSEGPAGEAGIVRS